MYEFQVKYTTDKDWEHAEDELSPLNKYPISKQVAIDLCMYVLKLMKRTVIEVRVREVGTIDFMYIGQNLE
jgi:hypothetical protein